MDDAKVADKLVKWVKKIKQWTLQDEAEAHNAAIAHLGEIKQKYGWKAMKRVFLHQPNCTTLRDFEHYCRLHKKELDKKKG